MIINVKLVNLEILNYILWCHFTGIHIQGQTLEFGSENSSWSYFLNLATV